MAKERRYSIYDVYLLDMWGNKEDGYEENERHLVGKIHISAPSFEEVDEGSILKAMKKLEIRQLFGPTVKALMTRNRRVIYIEDYTGDGTWWEIGEAKTRKPVYGVRYVGACVK